MEGLRATQIEALQGLAHDLLLFKQLAAVSSSSTSCASAPAPCGSLDVSRGPASAKDSEASANELACLKRKALGRAEKKLCQLALGVPPGELVNTRGEGFKRVKRVFEERVAWKKWLQEHRSLWKDETEKRRAAEEERQRKLKEGKREAIVQDAIPGTFLDPRRLEDLESPCLICSNQISSPKSALVCDACQGPHHLSCLASSKPQSSDVSAPVALPGNDPELLPSLNAALTVEDSEAPAAPLLASGDWYCPSCAAAVGGGMTAVKPLYGRVKEQARTVGAAGRKEHKLNEHKFKALYQPPGRKGRVGEKATSPKVTDARDTDKSVRQVQLDSRAPLGEGSGSNVVVSGQQKGEGSVGEGQGSKGAGGGAEKEGEPGKEANVLDEKVAAIGRGDAPTPVPAMPKADSASANKEESRGKAFEEHECGAQSFGSSLAGGEGAVLWPEVAWVLALPCAAHQDASIGGCTS